MVSNPWAEGGNHAIQTGYVLVTHVLEHPAAMRYNLLDICVSGFSDGDFACQIVMPPVRIGAFMYVNLVGVCAQPINRRFADQSKVSF